MGTQNSKKVSLIAKCISLIEQIGDVGCMPEYSMYERRNIRMVNYAVLIGIICFTGFDCVYLFSNVTVFLPVILLVLMFLPLLVFCIYLNYIKKHLLACILANLFFTFAIFLPLSLYMGSGIGNHYYFLMLAFVPVLTLRPEQIGLIVPLSGLNIFAYYWVEYTPPLIKNLSYYLTYDTARHMKDVSTFTAIVIVLTIVWVNQRILIRNEMELSGKTTKLKVALDHLRELATIDHLTGLYNRSYFDIRVLNEISRAKRYTAPLSMIIFDLDYFKGINDTYGHDVGDQVLKRAAMITSENIREADVLARWGGEEFVILVPQTNLEGAAHLAEKLRHELENNKVENFGSVTGSFGVAEYQIGETFQSWYKRVDKALYKAKEAGRNRVEKAK